MPIEETPPEAPDRLDRLINLATALNAEVGDLAQNSGRQFVSLARTARTNRLMIWIVVGGGVLDLILTVALGFTVTGMVRNAQRVDALTQRLDMAQTTQRQKALCPLYGIFLDSKSPEGRKAAPDPNKYDHAFVVIRDGYKVLECDKYLKDGDR
jgi:hypothetical protein